MRYFIFHFSRNSPSLSVHQSLAHTSARVHMRTNMYIYARRRVCFPCASRVCARFIVEGGAPERIKEVKLPALLPETYLKFLHNQCIPRAQADSYSLSLSLAHTQPTGGVFGFARSSLLSLSRVSPLPCIFRPWISKSISKVSRTSLRSKIRPYGVFDRHPRS